MNRTTTLSLCAMLATPLLLMSCGAPTRPADTSATGTSTTGTATAPAFVAERFISDAKRRENVDSIGFFQDDNNAWAIVTAKSTDYLVVFDARSGERLRVFGSTGAEPGQFKRPNGIQVIGNIMLVVERDNHRVQVTSLPDFKHVGFIGVDDLTKPYGLNGFAKNGGYELYVTDDYDPPANGALPADFYTRRIKHYRFTVDGGKVNAKLVKTFGDGKGPGRLFKVESILADPDLNRLYIADEKGDSKGVKIYDLDGQFTGKRLDTVDFTGEPEGLGLYLGEDRQYLVTTDQQPRVTVFHLFDRESLEHVLAFRGNKTNNTDGICISPKALMDMPKGALWAIDDDRALSGFDWKMVEAVIDAR